MSLTAIRYCCDLNTKAAHMHMLYIAFYSQYATNVLEDSFSKVGAPTIMIIIHYTGLIF